MNVKYLKTEAQAPLYMSVRDAKARYGIGQTSLYELFATEGCPAILKFGKKVLIPVAEFDAFFKAQLTQQTTQLHCQQAANQ